MIVHPASLENGRTLWRIAGEPGDRVLPRDSLWVNGLLRSIPASLEALWLALVLGPFARRLVVPGSIDEALAGSLGALVGTPIAGDVRRADTGIHSGVYGATLVRDSFDDYLAARVPNPSTFPVAVEHELEGTTRGFRVVANAGTFRRYLEPLDRVGELAALAMAAPVLGIQDITAFLCREELAGLDVELLIAVMRTAGVRLDLPLAQASVRELGILAKEHPSPMVAFGALYVRYRMFPAVMVEIYEDLKAGLVAGDGKPIPVRIAEYLARGIPRPGMG